MIVNDFQETLDTHGNLFRLALNEAEALARQTDYPHLFFPSLAMERVQAVVAWREAATITASATFGFCRSRLTGGG